MDDELKKFFEKFVSPSKEDSKADGAESQGFVGSYDPATRLRRGLKRLFPEYPDIVCNQRQSQKQDDSQA